MRAVVVVSGGVCSSVFADGELDVTVVDLDNIEAGDEPPEMPAGMGCLTAEPRVFIEDEVDNPNYKGPTWEEVA